MFGVGDNINIPIPASGELHYSMVKLGFECYEHQHTYEHEHDEYKCFPCKPGTYGNRIDDGCVMCPAGGYFQVRSGQVAKEVRGIGCDLCTNGTFVSLEQAPGSSTADCQVCPTGTNKSRFAGFRACPCLDGYYRKDRFGPCMLCPEHGINCTDEYQKLKPGFWWIWNLPTFERQNLVQEYRAFVKNLNTHDRNYDNTSTRFDGPLPISFPCLRGIDSCPALNGINGACGKGYEGWLCSKCSDDYYSWFEYCIGCPPIWRLILEVFGVFILVCLVVSISIWDLKKKINELKENQKDKSLKRSLVYLLVARFKIVLGYYQIAGAIFTSLHNIRWPKEVSKLAYVFRALELNIFKLLAKPSCYIESLVLNIYDEFLIGLVFCGLAVFLPAIVYYLRWLFVKVYKKLSVENVTEKLKGLRQNCYSVVVLMLFISYLSLCSVILSLMPVACQEFCVDENNNNCPQRLRSDYSIDCQTQKHKNYVVTAYVSLLFVIGYPVCLFVLIYRRRPKLCQENAGNDESVDRPRSGELNTALSEGSEDTGNVINEDTIQVLDTTPLVHAEQNDLLLNREDIEDVHEDVQGEDMEDINEDAQMIRLTIILNIHCMYNSFARITSQNTGIGR
ncbi:uncharacterized protein [Amphiura filiformis]|uniref:uncharacterized protein n=1 Tax=Amphiura filiformis TaxID=82378 RepID=UPI003B20EC31